MLNTTQNEVLWEKISAVKVVKFTTYDGEMIRSRPMKLLQDEFTGTLWFIGSAKSEMVDDIQHHPLVNITVTDAKNDIYVSISGKAYLSDDKAQLSAIWSSDVDNWFDEGINDENVALIAVDVTEAEYWDVKESSIKQAFNAMFSKANGKVPSQAEHKVMV